MTDTNVTELRPSPAKGERTPPKDATGALRARRHRAKRKEATVTQPGNPGFEKGNDFKGNVTVTRRRGVTPRNADESKTVIRFAQPRWQVADGAAYAAAIGLATVAAWFSIKGMVVLFPGAPIAVVAMAVAMEVAKLVTVGWLARRWRTTGRVWRLVLVTLVAGLAVINATGVYAQLAAAHVGERGAAQAQLANRPRASTHGSRWQPTRSPTLMHG